jgi:hypothetical protein
MATSVASGSLLGGFNNVNNNSAGRGGASAGVSSSNPFASTYFNPLAQGMPNGSSPAFGQVLYANTSSGTFNSTFGSNSSGLTGSSNNRGSSFGTYGGTSNASRGTSGGISGGARTAGIGGSMGGFGGSATVRTSTGSTTGGLSFPGGSMGTTSGRTSPTVATAVRFQSQPVASNLRSLELQNIIVRSTALSAPAGIAVSVDGPTVVLKGTVASEDERRLVENMLRLAPGVRSVRNELQVPATGGQ